MRIKSVQKASNDSVRFSGISTAKQSEKKTRKKKTQKRSKESHGFAQLYCGNGGIDRPVGAKKILLSFSRPDGAASLKDRLSFVSLSGISL